MNRWSFSLMALLWMWSACERVEGAPPKVNAKSRVTSKDQWQPLDGRAKRVIEACGTEPPFSGKYVHHKARGTYICGRCGSPLFASGTKFNSHSGWPSFDSAITGAVRELKDKDGHRVEIRCARCDGHLGHVFRGERMTPKDTRHCVNSVSLGFSGVADLREAFFAGGCFWGVEHLLEGQAGVLEVTSGYMGGHVKKPTYKQVCAGKTGHAEAVRVRYDAKKTNFGALTKRFFEVHDPTQRNRQGPDVGSQYRSAVFVTSDQQRRTAERLIGQLVKRGYKVVTEVKPAGVFWPAESYHQDYYRRKGSVPYCHERVPRFGVTPVAPPNRSKG